MIVLSEPQKEGLRQIEQLKEWMINTLEIPEDKCWFVQKSLNRVTWHTLMALKEKKYLEEMDYSENHQVIEYYRLIKQENGD